MDWKMLIRTHFSGILRECLIWITWTQQRVLSAARHRSSGSRNELGVFIRIIKAEIVFTGSRLIGGSCLFDRGCMSADDIIDFLPPR